MSQPDRELEDDLRTTSEHVEATAARIKQLEGEKQRLDPRDPRVDQLSSEIEALAAGLSDQAKVERKLARDLGPKG